MTTTTQINTQDSNTIYLILDGNKTVDKTSFLIQISELLKFPDYFSPNWDALNDCLNNNQDWDLEFNNIVGNITVLWIDPISFSEHNNSDFLTAIDILKSFTEDKTNPLTFIIGTKVTTINTNLYR